MQEPQKKWVPSLGWEDPLEECVQPTPLFLPGVVHGQRSPAGYSPWDHKKPGTTQRLNNKTYNKSTTFHPLMLVIITVSRCDVWCKTGAQLVAPKVNHFSLSIFQREWIVLKADACKIPPVFANCSNFQRFLTGMAVCFADTISLPMENLP